MMIWVIKAVESVNIKFGTRQKINGMHQVAIIVMGVAAQKWIVTRETRILVCLVFSSIKVMMIGWDNSLNMKVIVSGPATNINLWTLH